MYGKLARYYPVLPTEHMRCELHRKCASYPSYMPCWPAGPRATRNRLLTRAVMPTATNPYVMQPTPLGVLHLPCPSLSDVHAPFCSITQYSHASLK